MAKDNNKRKWEKDYEKYSTMNLDDEIKKLEGEVRNLRTSQAGIKDSTSKEYKDGKANQKEKEKEINKMKALKQNMPQVKRVIDQKDKLTNRLKQLNEQKKEVEDTKKLGQEGKKLEDELNKLLENEKKIKEALKNPKLTDESRAKLQESLNKNALAQKSNHEKFSANQLELTEKLNSPLQKKDFEKEIQATKNMLSKCNFIGRNLMEGKRMQEITTDLSKWEDKKFVDKTAETKKKTEKSKEPEKTEKPKEAEKGGKSKDDITEYEKAVNEKINEEDKDLAEISEFDQKHPRIAKVKNFFKNMGTKAKSAYEKVKDKITKKADEKAEISKPGGTKKQEEKHTKELPGKLSPEEIAEKKAAMMEKLVVRGSLMKTQTDLDNIAKQKAEAKKEKDDEGR